LDLGAATAIGVRNFAIMAVLWPAGKFADKELMAGGAASTGSPVTNTLLKQELKELKRVFDDPRADAALAKASRLVPQLEDSKKARKEFADLLRSILPKQASPDVDAANEFFTLPGDEVISRLSKPVPATLPKPGSGGGAAMIGGGAGAAAGAGQFFSGVKWGVYHMLNLVTYYQMKERAGLVGSTGVNQVLSSICAKVPGIKLHLIGHSFGGRLVAAAAAGTGDQPAFRVDTMTLIQAAFSHYGFSERYDGTHDGFFRKVIKNKTVVGPTVITCTQNDMAVGMAYPLASLLAGQVAAALGDKDDKYGGIGRNGAQKTPEAIDGTLLGLDGAYRFKPGRLYNLNSDAIIKGHSDIYHNEIVYAIFKAIEKT
jgi:hypothetical protein